jgi:hypothetical protein
MVSCPLLVQVVPPFMVSGLFKATTNLQAPSWNFSQQCKRPTRCCSSVGRSSTRLCAMSLVFRAFALTCWIMRDNGSARLMLSRPRFKGKARAALEARIWLSTWIGTPMISLFSTQYLLTSSSWMQWIRNCSSPTPRCFTGSLRAPAYAFTPRFTTRWRMAAINPCASLFFGLETMRRLMITPRRQPPHLLRKIILLASILIRRAELPTVAVSTAPPLKTLHLCIC